jgi:hypothetical protein
MVASRVVNEGWRIDRQDLKTRADHAAHMVTTVAPAMDDALLELWTAVRIWVQGGRMVACHTTPVSD